MITIQIYRAEVEDSATDPLSLAARAECRDALRQMPGQVMVPKDAVLELMQQSFIRGSNWERERAAGRAHTVQTMMHAVRAFLDARREVLAHAGDDCSAYHAISSALTAGTATAEQVRSYLLSEETQRRLNASGAAVSRWAQLVLDLDGFCH